jgi:hypothetical protein
MPIKHKKKLNTLFYNLYCDILALYEKNKPKFYYGSHYIFKTESNGHSVISEPIIKLLAISYYWDHKQDIHALSSFKKIVNYIKSSKEILNSDGVITAPADKKIIGKRRYEVWGIDYCFGPAIYSITQDLFECYNRPKINGECIKWNFLSVDSDKFNYKNDIPISRLIHKNCFIPAQKYYYFLQNFKINKSFKIKYKSKDITFKKLTDREKTLFLNSRLFGPENLSHDISSISTALIFDDWLKKEEAKNILAILRLCKSGQFRLYALAEVREDIIGKKKFTLNTYANFVERPLAKKILVLGGKNLNNSEIKKFKLFFKNNIDKMSKFKFGTECLNRLHSLDDEYKIPFIFFILESFFKNINQELSFRLSYCITKILNKPYEFTKIIQKLYGLRGTIVHGGTASELDNKIKKIKNKQGKVLFNNVKDCSNFLENIMKESWKIILDKELYDKDIEKEIF